MRSKVSVVKIRSCRQNKQEKSKAIHLVTFRLKCVLKIRREGDGREQTKQASRQVRSRTVQWAWMAQSRRQLISRDARLRSWVAGGSGGWRGLLEWAEAALFTGLCGKRGSCFSHLCRSLYFSCSCNLWITSLFFFFFRFLNTTRWQIRLTGYKAKMAYAKLMSIHLETSNTRTGKW